MNYCTQTPYFFKPSPTINKITSEVIINLVCDEFGISLNDIKSKSRPKMFTNPRKVAIKLIIKYLPHLSLKRIGAFFNMHHSTVIFCRDTIDKSLSKDFELRTGYNRIIGQIVLQINKG